MKPTFYEQLARHMLDHEGISKKIPAVEVVDDYLDLLWDSITFGDEEEFGQNVSIDDARIREQLGMPAGSEVPIYDVHTYLTNVLSEWVAPLAKFQYYGKKTFNISRGLTQLLHTTDLGGPYSMLEYPFPMFYINFESAPINILANGIEDDVVGVFVDATHTSSKVTFIAVGSKGYWERWSIPLDIDPMKQIDINDFQRRNQRQESPALELAVKTLLYLNSTNSETECINEYAEVHGKLSKAKESKKVKRLSKYLRTISSLEFFDVGRSIKIDRDAAGRSTVRDRVDNVEGWHYNYRFWVRGHFRNQAYGKARSERRLMWIKPHLKGPDEGAIVHKQYDVT